MLELIHRDQPAKISPEYALEDFTPIVTAHPYCARDLISTKVNTSSLWLDICALKCFFFCDLSVPVTKLASPFGDSTQVSTQVQLVATCDYCESVWPGLNSSYWISDSVKQRFIVVYCKMKTVLRVSKIKRRLWLKPFSCLSKQMALIYKSTSPALANLALHNKYIVFVK